MKPRFGGPGGEKALKGRAFKARRQMPRRDAALAAEVPL
jgi:hypothetical protein